MDCQLSVGGIAVIANAGKAKLQTGRETQSKPGSLSHSDEDLQTQYKTYGLFLPTTEFYWAVWWVTCRTGMGMVMRLTAAYCLQNLTYH